MSWHLGNAQLDVHISTLKKAEIDCGLGEKLNKAIFYQFLVINFQPDQRRYSTLFSCFIEQNKGNHDIFMIFC